jgi:hypothetical protein
MVKHSNQVQLSPFTESKDNMATTYEKIATTTLGSASSTITFSSIAGTYTDLRLVCVYTTASFGIFTRVRFNADNGGNYSDIYIIGDGSTASSARDTSSSFIGFGAYPNGISSGQYNLVETDIFSYAGSTFKSCLISSSLDKNGSGDVQRLVGLWRNTAAITEITISTNGGTMSAGSTATLYGILKA